MIKNMKKIYIAPTAIFENVEDEFLLQAISNTEIKTAAYDHGSVPTSCPISLGEDDEQTAGKRNHFWGFEEDFDEEYD